MFYGATTWNPWLILAQIVSIQCLYYLSLGIFLTLLVGIQVPRFTLHFFFDYTVVTGGSVEGRYTSTAFLMNAIAGAGHLLLLIENGKKCLDFSVTIYIIHLILCSLYAGVPRTVTWWVINLLCCSTTALIGHWVSRWQKLKEIPVRSTRLGIFQRHSVVPSITSV